MITPELKKIILGELSLDDFPLHDDLKAFEVPGWDSLSHVRIISAIEKAFELKFRNVEVVRLRSVGDLQRLIDQKKANR